MKLYSFSFVLSFFISLLEIAFVTTSSLSEKFVSKLEDSNTWIYVIIGHNKERVYHMKSFMDTLTGSKRMTYVPQISNDTEAKSFVTNRLISSKFYSRSHRNKFAQYCALSHLKVLGIFLSSPYDNALILEDDVEFSQVLTQHQFFKHPYINSTARQYLNIRDRDLMFQTFIKFFDLPPHLRQIQFIGYCYACFQNNSHNPVYQYVANHDVRSALESDQYFYTNASFILCAHAYLISKDTVKKFFEGLPETMFHPTWDNNLNQWLRKMSIPRVMPVVPIISQVPRSVFTSGIDKRKKGSDLRLFTRLGGCKTWAVRLG